MSAEEEVPDIPQPPSPTAEAVEEYSEKSAAPPDDGQCSEDNEEDYLKTKPHNFSQQWNKSWQTFTKETLFFMTKVEATLKTRKRRIVCCKSRLQP